MAKKKSPTKKTTKDGSKGRQQQDPPILVGGGGSTVICIPVNAIARNIPPSYVNDPALYQAYYEVGWDTLSVYVKGITGGDKKHRPNKPEHYTAFSKNG